MREFDKFLGFTLPPHVDLVVQDYLRAIFLNNGRERYWKWSIFIFFVAIVILCATRLLKVHKNTFRQSLILAGMAAYLYLVYMLSVFGRTPSSEYGIALLPFSTFDTMRYENNYLMLVWFAINYCMFVPVGFVLPFYDSKRITWKSAMMMGVCLSYAVEFLQLILRRGNFELFGDPWCNISGLMIGYGIAKGWLAFRGVIFSVVGSSGNESENMDKR